MMIAAKETEKTYRARKRVGKPIKLSKVMIEYDQIFKWWLSFIQSVWSAGEIERPQTAHKRRIVAQDKYNGCGQASWEDI